MLKTIIPDPYTDGISAVAPRFCGNTSRLFRPISYLVILSFAFSPVLRSETTAKDPGAADKAATAGQADENWKSEKRQAALRVQLFLDREGFGPGKIDGRWGGFSEKAAKRWNASGNDGKIATDDAGGLDLEKAKGIPFSGNLLTTYVISEKDQSLLGKLPDGPKEKARMDRLPYTSLMELVSEKFHADPDFIREINDLASNGDLKVGTELKVPNVAEPFDLSEPMALAKKAENKKEGDKKEDKAKGDGIGLTVLRDERVVEVRKAGKLIHSFPITPGANDNRSPEGNWEIVVISWMPQFRWDKSMLEDGTRSEDSYLLPPGPNNPVGIVWMGLNSEGIGLHGTPYPDSIGRSRSHGCIRLSNWDALKLAKTVHKGTPVTVK